MKRSLYSRISGVGILALLAAIILPLSFYSSLNAQSSRQAADDGCSSGKLSASLTGWMMDNEMPTGAAGFDADKKQLSVSVESVKLPDGTKLEVLIGDKKVGELNGLAKGESKGQITLDRDLSAGDRIRILNDKRPVVSGNLTCDASTAGKTSN
ncbi:MAG TPA: hypothetical protein VL325_09030 [Pyrinomonadaceae bacterium]|nr:hypothetical protein [Pyrinomonadaceae bacterium]